MTTNNTATATVVATPNLDALRAALNTAEEINAELETLEEQQAELTARMAEAVKAFHKAAAGCNVVHPRSGRSLTAVLNAGKGQNACYIRGLKDPKAPTGSKKQIVTL